MPRRTFNAAVHTRNKAGKLVSKSKSAQMKSNPWSRAVHQARRELGITRFIPIRKGERLYELAKKIYNK
jgi:hypothetical protein